MKRLFVLLFMLLVLVGCNFGNTAGLHKEWAAMLDELENRSETFRAYVSEENDMGVAATYMYDFEADSAAKIMIGSQEDGAVIQIFSRDTDESDLSVDELPHALEIDDFSVHYDMQANEMTAILDDRKHQYDVTVWGLEELDAEDKITDIAASLTNKSSTALELLHEKRESIMGKALLFPLGKKIPQHLHFFVSDDFADLQLAYESEEGQDMLFRMAENEYGLAYDDDYYDVETLTYDHRPVEKFSLKEDVGFLPTFKYRFERDGVHYEFHIMEATNFDDNEIFEQIRKMRR